MQTESLIFLIASIACAVALVARRMAPSREPPAPQNAGRDLLVEAEEAEFIAQPSREKAPIPDSEPTADVVWEEDEDVFTPAACNAADLLSTLSAEHAINLAPASPNVFLRRSAGERMHAHLRTDTSIELGGLLLGSAAVDSALGCFLLIVERVLPADNGKGTATSFAYTQEAWKRLAPEIERLNPDWTILGSYHSHPDMGVFLSSTDLATQAEVFSRDWQIAIVVDPIRGETALFTGPHGKPCDHWWVVEDP